MTYQGIPSLIGTSIHLASKSHAVVRCYDTTLLIGGEQRGAGISFGYSFDLLPLFSAPSLSYLQQLTYHSFFRLMKASLMNSHP